MSRLFLPAILLVAVIVFTSYRLMHGKQTGKGAETGFAVVELYTSEGCSSCPPADEAVANLLQLGKKNVYVLGFHVDYWNYLGWKDVYSDASYSERQQQYGSLFGLNSVYTPQAVVNGQTEFTGSDTRKLTYVVDNALNQQAAASLQLSATSTDGKTVNVAYKISGKGGVVLYAALVQLHAQSNVRRGENSGRVLNHVNVVRSFKSVNPTAQQGNISFDLPDGLTANSCSIIVFTQDAKWKVTAAAQTAIQ